MKIRRCAILFLEPREQLEVDLAALCRGTRAFAAAPVWIALAPHLGEERILDAAEVAAIGAISPQRWLSFATLARRHPRAVLRSLLAKGLLIADADDAARETDASLRATHWYGLAAAAHAFTRWSGIDAPEQERLAGLGTLATAVERHGKPPPATTRRGGTRAIALQRPAPTAFDRLLARRATCRNFAGDRAVGSATSARLLQRVFGAQAVQHAGRGIALVKKTSPSGGGLHPTEAWVLAQRLDGIAPGLYHYQPARHALQPLRRLTSDAAAALALRMVAGQAYFADAAALVVLTCRFRRSFWKYRNHQKAWRAVLLDAGHLSQTLYLAATEAGLGAFVTVAVNEKDIEAAFDLDPLQDGVIAVCGFGLRAAERREVEFDPLHAVWSR